MKLVNVVMIIIIFANTLTFIIHGVAIELWPFWVLKHEVKSLHVVVEYCQVQACLTPKARKAWIGASLKKAGEHAEVAHLYCYVEWRLQ